MKIAKALKLKNQLAGEIAKLQTLLSGNNSFEEGKIVRFDAAALYEEYKNKLEELIQLKRKIAQGNFDIWEKIFRITELKGKIQFLRTLPVREGISKERDWDQGGTRTIEVKWTAVLNPKMIQDEITLLEKEIIDLQDQIDEYNHTHQV